MPFGPGIWPGPRCQARWAGRGLQGQGRTALSAWALACHALPSTVFSARRLFTLSVSARYRPSQTAVTGTSPGWRPTGSARRCCYKCRRHVGYRTQDPERRDLCDLLQASLLCNLHRRLLRHSFALVIVAKATNHDVPAERDEEQQRGSRQRRAQPADRPATLPGRRRLSAPNRQGKVDADPSLLMHRRSVGYRCSTGNLSSRVTRSIGECRMSLWSAVVVSICPPVQRIARPTAPQALGRAVPLAARLASSHGYGPRAPDG